MIWIFSLILMRFLYLVQITNTKKLPLNSSKMQRKKTKLKEKPMGQKKIYYNI